VPNTLLSLCRNRNHHRLVAGGAREFFDRLPQQVPHVVVIGNGFRPGVVQPLRSNLLTQISQDKTKRSGDISEWFIEQLIKEIIPNSCAHS
jgi:hypothetical protein